MKGFASFFQHFLQSKCSPEGRTVLETLAHQEDLSLHRDLIQLAEIVIEYQAKALAPPEGLLTHLRELMTRDPEEDERVKRRQEEAADCVSILTVHMSKGLEFEIVFALGLASGIKREEEVVQINNKIVPFDPENSECRQAALENDAEKMRYLYVALTRAKKRVYIPAVCEKEGRSPIELFFQKLTEEASPSLQSVIAVLETIQGISYEKSDRQPQSLRTPPPEIVYDWAFQPSPHLQWSPETICSFSTLNRTVEPDRKEKISLDSSIKNAHTLPPGITTGKILHRILERIFTAKTQRPALIVQEEVQGTHLQGWEDVVAEIVEQTLQIPLSGSFCLHQISGYPEIEFAFSHGKSLLKGFIDLVFQINDKYYLLDWKSNWLGNSDEDYTVENMNREMEQHGYFLQAAIYAEALKRHVKLFDIRPFEECFGGAIYIFLRGRAAFQFFPDIAVI